MQLVDSTNVLRCLLGFALCVLTEQADPQVLTYEGLIAGHYKTSYNGRTYEAYEGIPYALPPTGNLRFEPPINSTDYSHTEGVLITKEIRSVCMQYDEKQGRIRGTEDCLYLNVYCPVVNWQRRYLLPVIFYIHGDDFQTGSGGEHGPKYLLDRDVVVVTFNYRLGPLGFLSTEDNVVPGNMGLKDQVVALQWVWRSIKRFGGDYSNITMFGHGAGGASVHYHYMTKQTWGLFNKGMSLSGTALAPWAQTYNPLEKAKKLASLVECPTNTIPAMVKCLKSKPADHIVHAAREFRGWLKSPYSPFGPVTEKGKSGFMFINKSPSAIMKSGKVRDIPWITGIVEEEGLTIADDIVSDQNRLDEMNNNWESIAPYLLEFNDTILQRRHPEISHSIKEHYLGSSQFDKLTIVPTMKMIGDRLFVARAAQAAMLQASAGVGPIRFYKFSYKGKNSFSDINNSSGKSFSATHKDDLAYVFELPVDTTTSPDDETMRNKMIDLWISYAKDKYGDPEVGVDWTYLKENSKEINYLHIVGPDVVKMDTVTDLGDQFFWRSLSVDGRDVVFAYDPTRRNAHDAKSNSTIE